MAKAKADRKTKAVAVISEKTLAGAKLERWVPREVERSQLVNAPYNPRTISDTNKRKLKKQLGKNGLVSPITWNKRTGHIVGGHQRIEQLDSIMGSKDYRLTVAEIDVAENEEKALNIALNNDQNMGAFDVEAMGKVLQDATVDLERTGFDTADIYDMFGHGVLGLSEERSGSLAELGSKLRDMQELYKNIRKTNADRDNTEFYLQVVFKDSAECDAFLERYKLPANRYHQAEVFTAAISSSNDLKALGSAAGSGSASQRSKALVVKSQPS